MTIESRVLIRTSHHGLGTDGPLSLSDLLPPTLTARLEGLDVKSRRVFAGKLQGERRSKRRGRSVEFDDFRPYVAGDDLRHIDWNVYARLDRFFIKLFQAEEDLTVHVVLDASASMLAGAPAKLIAAARLCSALSYAALVNNNRLLVSAIGLPTAESAAAVGPTATGDGGVARSEPLRGRAAVQRALSFLLSAAQAAAEAPLNQGRATDFAAGLRTIAAARAGRGIMVIVSDLLIPGGTKGEPGYAPGLRYVAGSEAYETFVFQVLAPGELDPAAEAAAGSSSSRSPLWGDLRLLDAETGSAREVTVTADLIKRYRTAAARFVEGTATWCRGRGIEHTLVTSDLDPATGVVDALRKVGVLA
ncbi:MAG TPA: DUF58 domain-containing protein [Phycisphaerales bacterium]|nr:DUF58 domain-containing protein [Phycisphaerales bacterium]